MKGKVCSYSLKLRGRLFFHAKIKNNPPHINNTPAELSFLNNKANFGKVLETHYQITGNMVSFSLEGKTALITGAAYGIGFAIAEAYAKAGARIFFNCRSQHHLDQALADYAAKGIEAKGYICDVTDEEEVRNMVADIEKTIGVIDILVNNAGIIKRPR
jgi:Dehydrogenases with different specificities (related to short-chain alcohol dehydrogenases)